MNLLIRDDSADRIEGRHHPQPAVVVERQVAVARIGVLPRDHEDGVALLDQIAHQRVLRREVEDIVFHDPGRDDQDRLRSYLVREWGVLDEFDQLIAVNDAAFRYRHVPAWLEGVGAIACLSCHEILQVLHVVLEPPDQVQTSGLLRLFQNLGVGSGKVGWRENIKHLARQELQLSLVLSGHTGYISDHVVPPLLLHQKTLLNQIEGGHFPGIAAKPVVLRQWINAGRHRVGRTCACHCIAHVPTELFSSLFGDFQLFPRSSDHMRRPIEPCVHEGGGRQPMREARKPNLRRMVERFVTGIMCIRTIIGVRRHRRIPFRLGLSV